MHYWYWIFERVRRQLWWRAVAFGIVGMLTAVLALVVERIVPWEIPFDLSPDAVGSLLNIIASSMLAVTTFSLGVMTAAFGAATTNVTPRATSAVPHHHRGHRAGGDPAAALDQSPHLPGAGRHHHRPGRGCNQCGNRRAAGGTLPGRQPV